MFLRRDVNSVELDILSICESDNYVNPQIARIHWPFIGPSDAARLAHGCKS